MDDAWNFKVAFPFDSVFLRLDSVPSGSSRSLSISIGLFIPMAWNFNSLQLRDIITWVRTPSVYSSESTVCPVELLMYQTFTFWLPFGHHNELS